MPRALSVPPFEADPLGSQEGKRRCVGPGRGREEQIRGKMALQDECWPGKDGLLGSGCFSISVSAPSI